MDEQTKQAVANAIDNALTTVAAREYNRLAKGLDAGQKAKKVECALRELQKL